MTAEHWDMTHPTLGHIEVFIGDADSLRTIDPDFPDGEGVVASEKKRDKKDKKDQKRKKKRRGADKLFEYLDIKVLVLRDGTPLARCQNLEDHKVSLDAGANGVEPGEYGGDFTVSQPMVQIQTNLTKNWVTNVRVKDEHGWVNFDPPAGSKAEKRFEEMEESPFKRWFYPLIGGVGKGGWALVVLFLFPLLGRLLPDFDIPLPDWDLPSIPWPDIDWPDIDWPSFDLPDVNLPDVHLPGWLEPVIPVIDFLVEYAKVWVPVVIGIVVGIAAVRNNRKSQRRKAEWEKNEDK